jgi:hypothetical protein
MACRFDERMTQLVFLAAGRFSDEHELSRPSPFAKNNLRGMTIQSAAAEFVRGAAECGKIQPVWEILGGATFEDHGNRSPRCMLLMVMGFERVVAILIRDCLLSYARRFASHGTKTAEPRGLLIAFRSIDR